MKNGSQQLNAILCPQGADVLEFPMIELVSSPISTADKQKLSNIFSYDWLVLTSQYGVRFFFDHLKKVTQSTALPSHLKIATVGNQTSQELLKYGIEATITGGSTSYELGWILYGICEEDSSPPQKILRPLGDKAHATISDMLRGVAHVDSMVVYRNKRPLEIDNDILQRIVQNSYDMLICTSPSSFKHLKELLPSEIVPTLKIACIGTTTAKALKEDGLTPLVMPSCPSIKNLAQKIIQYYDATQ